MALRVISRKGVTFLKISKILKRVLAYTIRLSILEGIFFETKQILVKRVVNAGVVKTTTSKGISENLQNPLERISKIYDQSLPSAVKNWNCGFFKYTTS